MLIETKDTGGGRVRLDLGADTEAERAQLEAFVEALGGAPVTSEPALLVMLGRRLRVSNVGFDADRRIVSLAFDSIA